MLMSRFVWPEPVRRVALALPLALAALAAAVPAAVSAAVPRAPARQAPAAGAAQGARILAVVNGAPITNIDVENRARLFALSANLSATPEVLDRLKPQILRQLIDERLRMQAVEKAEIVVPDKAVADAIAEIEKRNGMAPGALRKRLGAGGVGMATLVDQLRTQLGWTQLLREKLGPRGRVDDAAVAAEERLLAQEAGQPQFHVAEIFIPVETGSRGAAAQSFAQTVISELRAGAPFPVVAAQFSQSQTALAGGDLGWVAANQLDPAVARVVAEMPVGAVSNPVAVPGGIDIVTLAGKRVIGRDMATVLSVRQVFVPFTTPLNPQAPTAQQIAALQRARQISQTVKSCPQMEQLAASMHSDRPADPGPIRLENVQPPAFRQILAALVPGQPTQPLVAPNGIGVMILCSKERKNLAQMTPQEIRLQILSQRVNLLSRQLQQDLRSQADIELHPSGGAA